MNSFIATWFCADKKGEESRYLQIPLSSSSTQFQFIYWQCILAFFAVSLRFNKNYPHCLFTNCTVFPVLNKTPVDEILNSYGVKIVTIDGNSLPPVDYYENWRNQFYIFDIFQFIIKNHPADDRFIILDSDCIWIKAAEIIFNDIKTYNILGYDLNYGENDLINGISRRDMKEIFEYLNGQKINDVPIYYGGEFFAGKVSIIRKIMDEYMNIQKPLLKLYQQHRKKLNEEAHVLSYIYGKLRIGNNQANQYIRRIWTSFRYFTATESDFNLMIWHLPAEKQRGFKRLVKKVLNPDSDFWKINLNEFPRYLGNYLQIPQRKIDFGYYVDKIISGINRFIKNWFKLLFYL